MQTTKDPEITVEPTKNAILQFLNSIAVNQIKIRSQFWATADHRLAKLSASGLQRLWRAYYIDFFTMMGSIIGFAFNILMIVNGCEFDFESLRHKALSYVQLIFFDLLQRDHLLNFIGSYKK